MKTSKQLGVIDGYYIWNNALKNLDVILINDQTNKTSNFGDASKVVEQLENDLETVFGDNILDTYVRWSEKILKSNKKISLSDL